MPSPDPSRAEPRNRDTARQAALALATGQSIRSVAERLGVAERTVRNWRKNPRFRALVDRHRSELTDRTIGALSSASTAAVGKLVALLKAEDEGVQLRAATVLLDKLPILSEYHDLSERVRQLEAAAEDRSVDPWRNRN